MYLCADFKKLSLNFSITPFLSFPLAVCQKFQVLEDQTVAHVLQEQEIQQHLSANKLKSLGVRLNLELARKLQEQEDERSRQLQWKLHKYM
ncbi:hypothetical protein chiPu_0027299 [Chiloscyllium punctatum]|uniref:Coiled-coil domain-containing protein n=1 Tax=Chiloscyllium punctatum TaxID=137246 RepID=A0A401TLC9_CHIPU|nr:hypothetical protein [Chiloscyllium punctatum]